MGFTTGFTGGVTLTLGVAYLAVLTHERNRLAQAQALRSQSHVLNSLVDPTPLPPPQSRAELAREERGSLVEVAKDRWNGELENAIRWVQRTDWSELREGMESAVAGLLGSGLQKSREGIDEAEILAKPKVQEAIDRSKAAAQRGAHEAAVGVDRAAAAVVSGAERVGVIAEDQLRYAGTKAANTGEAIKAKTHQAWTDAKHGAQDAADRTKAKGDQVLADARSGAHDAADAIRNSGGTVDAARDAVRDSVDRGIEKSKEVIGKVQEAVGLASDKVDSGLRSSSSNTPSAVEMALQERYEKPNGLGKSVEEVLAERYIPVDARDNSHLRGV